jgi:DnaJ-class molecular chaperone
MEKEILMTCFEILGLFNHATVEQVKIAYRRLSLAAHPDHGGDPVAFHRLHLAYRLALAEAERPLLCPGCQGLGVLEVRVGWSTLRQSCNSCGGRGTTPRV